MKHPKDNGAARLEGRFWPTLEQRPGETIREWCLRLDSYQGPPKVA